MRMSPAWIAAGLAAAGIVALAYAAPRARAAELDAARPWVLWEVSPDRAMPMARGTYTARTACEVDLASLANVLPKASRLTCVRTKDGEKR